jgi:predicted AAA+ superfamily ATPase
MVFRKLIDYVKYIASYYPIISVAGSRQAGKSTLLMATFPNLPYISLENPDTLELMKQDTRGFLLSYPSGVIIDEAQKYPDLFSYLQGIVDNDRTPGRFILSGSQNYLMLKGITQSLAGRVALATLYPFDLREMSSAKYDLDLLEPLIINGFYPGKLVNNIPTKLFYKNYLKTYLERDVLDLINVSNLNTFRSFVKLLAHHVGSIINYTNLSNALNISVNTVKAWISILESSYIIYLLPPYHKNFGKRIIKSPKLYFSDSGLLCYLLDITEERKLIDSPKHGLIFENFVIAEKLKQKAHDDSDIDYFYFRDSNGLEVDLIEQYADMSASMIEIKGSSLYKNEYLTYMEKLTQIDPNFKKYVIYKGEDRVVAGVEMVNWRRLGEVISRM